MSTDTNLKQTANTATATQTKPSVPAAPAAPASTVSKVEPEPVVECKYKSEDFNGAPIVKLRLLTADTMQYDPIYHLKLDSIVAVPMPLTPFFAERIGRTIELCV